MAKLLLADDRVEWFGSLRLSLAEMGHEIVEAKNGADALKRLAEKPPPDVVLLDIGMPGMDGLEVLRKLGPSAPPVVVMTGYEMPLGEFAEFPMVKRVLGKPLNLKDVVDAINGVLAGNGPPAAPAAEGGC